jgi:hypothetical protein
MDDKTNQELKEIKSLILDIHRLHFNEPNLQSREALKQRMKAQILMQLPKPGNKR